MNEEGENEVKLMNDERRRRAEVKLRIGERGRRE